MERIKCPKDEKENKWNTKVLFGGLGILVIVVIILFQPLVNYYVAIHTMKNGKYEQAIEIFEKIKNEDSMEKIEECRYLLADELLTKGECQRAEEIFVTLGAYKDAEEKIVECEFVKGKELILEKKYLEAIDILSALGEYKDAKEQLVKCINQKAKEYMSNKKDQNVIDLYSSYIEEYPKEIEEGLCEIAQLYIEQKQYYNAVKVLKVADSPECKKVESLLDSIFEQYHKYFYKKAEREYSNANFEIAKDCYVYAQEKGYELPAFSVSISSTICACFASK